MNDRTTAKAMQIYQTFAHAVYDARQQDHSCAPTWQDLDNDVQDAWRAVSRLWEETRRVA